jgi:predicted nucleotidyltransferase
VLTELAEANRPEQFALLEYVAERLTSSDAVTTLLVRGSLARGTADRLSDIDFVVGVRDSQFEEYVSVLDALATTELGSILPGWRDSIVGDMGGLGFVYLIGWAGQLQQLDLYLVPASRIGQVREQADCQTIFTRDRSAEFEPDSTTARFVSGEVSRPRTCTDLLVEAMVVGYLIRKRISRGQRFIAYSEVFLFNTAAKNLIKAALAPRVDVLRLVSARGGGWSDPYWAGVPRPSDGVDLRTWHPDPRFVDGRAEPGVRSRGTGSA